MKHHLEITAAIQQYAPNHIAIESLFSGGGRRNKQDTGEAIGVIRLAAFQHGYGIYNYTPTAVKKTLTGRGRAEKREVAAAVKERTGFDAKSNHVADAVAIALTHLEFES